MTRNPALLRRYVWAASLCTSFFASGCEEPEDHAHETELITTVRLELLAEGATAPVVAAWRDLDGFGGTQGSAEPLRLTLGTSYAMTITLLDESLAPAIDLTPEIVAEAEEHQFLVYGSVVRGPASTVPTALLEQEYADLESTYGQNNVGQDLVVGLRHTLLASSAGTGDLHVMLRHLPELNGVPQKEASLAGLHAAGEPLPGDVDVDVRFSVTVE